MNKRVVTILTIVAIIAFSGVLFFIVTDANHRIELILCTVVAVCACIVMFLKRK